MKTPLRRLRAAGGMLVDTLGIRPPGRAVEVRADDLFLVSYPKSGNTWVRFLIANLLAGGRELDFSTVHKVVPDIYRDSANALRRAARPRLIKSHEYLDPRYPRVIYVVRDPRDVVVSYFHQHLRRGLIDDAHGLEAYVTRFLRGEVDPYGSWREHVGGWLGARGDEDAFLLVRYEDLARAPLREAERIVAFLGLRRGEADLARALERSSFDRMRRIERDQALGGTLPRERIERPFLRSATVGGWRGELPADLAAAIEARWRPTMAGLGYAAADGATGPVAAGAGLP